ncbi:hypothetical protein PMG11_07182 [Penicillium brasilianum]|uniref:F-box domain-containing protein n=1 Tax=Penicillium brasilianum TaxID=104259 RepID=A0A0F7TP50_PENBI|nr:hypothetical protein PMG11_07182 [Penicillium brasilianum]
MPWLPPEILTIVTSYILDPATLVSLRLVNKDWAAAAKWQLDRSFLLLNMNKLTLDIMEKKRKDPRALYKARGVIINHPDDNYWIEYLEDHDSRGFKTDKRFKVFQRLSFYLRSKVHQFPNLDYFTLHFRPPRDHTPVPNYYADKEDLLRDAVTDLFKALKKLGTVKSRNGKSLEELSIQSLPVQVRLYEIPSGGMEYCKRVLTKLHLKTLKLGLVSSTVWSHAIDRISANQQVGDPPYEWIKPTMRTLQNLSITCWGFYLRNIAGAVFHTGLFLPFLESLELRGCAFTSDYQLSWITRHGRTLSALKLDDCAIVDRLVLWPRSSGEVGIDVSLASLRVVDNGRGGKVRLYNTRWAHYFDKMKEDLPQLKHFEFGSSRVRAAGEEGPFFQSERHDGPSFNVPSKFLFGLFPDRYVKLGEDSGCHCCSWVLQNEPQQLPKRQGLILDNPDRDALRRLLQKIGQVVQEDADSDHAGYVRKLMGRVKADETHTSEDDSSKATSESATDWDFCYPDGSSVVFGAFSPGDCNFWTR